MLLGARVLNKFLGMSKSVPITTQPIGVDRFYSNGRGPELQRIVWGERGLGLRAIEYFNNDDVYDDAHLKHVRIIRPQVIMTTPEEVIDFCGRATAFGIYRPAAAIDYGHSDWFQSFNRYHLSKCRHFQLLFCDELFDVICESLEFREGGFDGK